MNGQDRILVVEDDDIDFMTVQRSFRELGVPNPVMRALDGEDGLAFLTREGETRPGLILLDLNMPRMNGIEFLAHLRKRPELNDIPVVVLTTSGEAGDRVAAFDLIVSGFMVKPLDYSEYLDTLRVVHDYWTQSESGSH